MKQLKFFIDLSSFSTLNILLDSIFTLDLIWSCNILIVYMSLNFHTFSSLLISFFFFFEKKSLLFGLH